MFKITTTFTGYNNKADTSKLPSGALVFGSQNVISTDADNIKIREGYKLFGDAKTGTEGVVASTEFITNRGLTIPLRAYDEYLEYYYDGEWRTLEDSWSSVNFDFANSSGNSYGWWDANEKTALLLFVNGDTNIYSWSGGIAEIASVGTNTITKSGTTTWAEEGLSIYDNRKTDIEIVDYTSLSGCVITIKLEKINDDGSISVTNHTLTEGADWTAATSNTATATSLSSALDGITGITSASLDEKIIARVAVDYNFKQFTSSDNTNLTKTKSRYIKINGVEYTYTGGEGTTTLTGVTPDPAVASPAISAGDIAVQGIIKTDNSPASVSYTNDIIEIFQNQLWVASRNYRSVYVSKNTDYTDFAYSSPRVPGEGVILNLDANPTALIPQEESMYISAGKSLWYKSDLQLSSDLQKENLFVTRLNTTEGEASQYGAVTKIKNSIAYISNEPTLDTLGRLENIETPQSKNLSDPIKTDFDGYDFTNTHLRYFKNNLYIALPSESKVLIFNLEKGFWESPQTLPVSRFMVYDNKLYGHSNVGNETYELFTGTNDNGTSIEAKAVFAYNDYGTRTEFKEFTEWFTEGYIQSNTVLNLVLDYEYEGFLSSQEFEIDGNDENILFQNITDVSLGKAPLGQNPLGGTTQDISQLAKFRIKNTMVKKPFFEIRATYSSNQVDGRWEVLSFGGDIFKSNNKTVKIKK